MKKKNLVLMGAAAMLSMAIAGSVGVAVASAKDLTESSSSDATTTVTYTVDNTWKVTIPDEIEINAESGTGTGTVTASDVKIEKGTHLEVTVESANEYKLKNGSNELDYTLKKDETQLNDSSKEVLHVQAGTDNGDDSMTATLTAELTAESKKYSTGNKEYSDTLTFTVNDEAAGN